MLEIQVVPGAAFDAVGPYEGGTLHIRVTRRPVDGDANRAVLRLVARSLAVAPTRLILVAGERSRRKRVRVEGLDDAEVDRRLRRIGQS